MQNIMLCVEARTRCLKQRIEKDIELIAYVRMNFYLTVTSLHYTLKFYSPISSRVMRTFFSNLNLSFSGKVEPHSSFNMGYLVAPYSYTNGAAGGLPVSMVS